MGVSRFGSVLFLGKRKRYISGHFIGGSWSSRSVFSRQRFLGIYNKESDIDEDSDDDEEDWKVEAEESDSDIDEGEMSDDDGERRIRAKRI